MLMPKPRSGDFKLAIETGRYSRNRTDRNQRVCMLCNHGDI